LNQIDTTYKNYFLLIITDSYRFDERKSEETPVNSQINLFKTKFNKENTAHFYT